MKSYPWSVVSSTTALVLGSLTLGGVAAQAAPLKTADAPPASVSPTSETFHELPFSHPVSLASAVTVTAGAGLPIEGYRFESDSIVGDFWLDGGLTIEQFLNEIDVKTGTAPEIVAAYVDGADYQARSQFQRKDASVALGESLPVFDAPPADRSLAALRTAGSESSSKSSDSGLLRAGAQTWQPNDAETMITPMGNNLAISAKYSWWGLDPFASPLVMADSWGMEFQTDFYSANRAWPPGSPVNFPGKNYRPNCAAPDYKDWGSASNRPFDWFAWVISGTDYVYAPGSLGLYGDYNDLSDLCTASSIAVGMAAPLAMPSSVAGTNHLDIYLYPAKGQATQSPIGAIVQPVSRGWCETFPSMPLTDCMGVTPGTYPGPGPTGSRMVLNSSNNNLAPSLCWTSTDFGTVPATIWDCNW